MIRRPPATLPMLALLATLVMAFGLPRLFVLCTHHGGEATLEWEHPAGSCCHHGDAGAPHDDGDPAVLPGGGCEHESLAIGLAPPPRNADRGEVPAPACVGIAPVAFEPPVWPAEPPHPPATGPPRIDRRTALRATSLLLL